MPGVARFFLTNSSETNLNSPAGPDQFVRNKLEQPKADPKGGDQDGWSNGGRQDACSNSFRCKRYIWNMVVFAPNYLNLLINIVSYNRLHAICGLSTQPR